jgi:hypothetical protein
MSKSAFILRKSLDCSKNPGILAYKANFTLNLTAMKKVLFIQLFIFFCFLATQAQVVFLGKSQKNIMDSLFKTNYRLFNGQVVPGERYILNFQYDVFQDTAYVKKMESSKYGIGEQDTIHTNHYHFVFDNNSMCIITTLYYSMKDYKKVISDLDLQYKNKTKDNIWIDSSGKIEVVITKDKITHNFNVDFRLINK